MIQELNLKFNGNINFDFKGGNMSSNGGFFLFKEYLSKINFQPFVKSNFKLKGDFVLRKHTNDKLILENIYLNVLGYHNQNHADDLRHNLLASCFNNKSLASQPTHSIFIDRLDRDSARQLEEINGHILDSYFNN